jgi:hypothetical protein
MNEEQYSFRLADIGKQLACAWPSQWEGEKVLLFFSSSFTFRWASDIQYESWAEILLISVSSYMRIRKTKKKNTRDLESMKSAKTKIQNSPSFRNSIVHDACSVFVLKSTYLSTNSVLTVRIVHAYVLVHGVSTHYYR